jgi:hypothetical protein
LGRPHDVGRSYAGADRLTVAVCQAERGDEAGAVAQRVFDERGVDVGEAELRGRKASKLSSAARGLLG